MFLYIEEMSSYIRWLINMIPHKMAFLNTMRGRTVEKNNCTIKTMLWPGPRSLSGGVRTSSPYPMALG